MYSDELKNKKNRYQQCYIKVLNVSNYLVSSTKTLQFVIEAQKNCYLVNDFPGGSNYLERILEKEKNIYKVIVNSILPNLQEVINSLNDAIEEAIIQESEIGG